MFIPNKKILEFMITNRCDRKCPNCQSMTSQAPNSSDLTLEILEEWLRETIILEWKWQKLKLMGGEPTLHNELQEIFKILEKYKKINPKCIIEIRSHGHGKTSKILTKLPNWVTIITSKSKAEVLKFRPFNLAPIDDERADSDFSLGCWRASQCGIALGVDGLYYPCPVSPHIDRVLKLNLGIHGLSNLLNTDLNLVLKDFCQFCGYYNYKSEGHLTKQLNSPFWEKAFKRYNADV